MFQDKKEVKKEILKLSEVAEDEYGDFFDLKNDGDAKIVFDYVAQNLGLSYRLILREEDGDGWVEMHYFSEKIGRGIIWDCNVGNFDDLSEMADYIIHIQEEITAFEKALPVIRI